MRFVFGQTHKNKKQINANVFPLTEFNFKSPGRPSFSPSIGQSLMKFMMMPDDVDDDEDYYVA